MRQEAMRASFQATPQQPALGRVHPPQSNPMTQSMTVPPMLNNNAMWQAQANQANETIQKMSHLQYLKTKHQMERPQPSASMMGQSMTQMRPNTGADSFGYPTTK